MNGPCDPPSRRLHRTRSSALLAAAVLALLGPWPAWAEETAAPAAPATAPPTAAPAVDAPAIDPALFELWIHQLDDDRYSVREAAQKRLAAAKAPALEHVAAAAAAGSLECSTRAVSVLVAWADADDRQLAIAALEKIAALANRVVEAAVAMERLAEIREVEAVETIKKLGGRFEHDHQLGMIGGPGGPVQIIIGPQWTGGVDGLRHVAAVRSARTLSLHSAPLGDEAAAELASATHLQRIELYGTNVTADAVAKLQPRMPQTVFDVRGGARLGIRGLIIEQIVVDSPAEKAGLQRNDKITEFAGQPIETFEQLTQQIATCKPGDTVTVKVLRGADTLEKKVTFDRWGDDVRSTTPEPAGPFLPVTPVPGQRR